MANRGVPRARLLTTATGCRLGGNGSYLAQQLSSNVCELRRLGFVTLRWRLGASFEDTLPCISPLPIHLRD